MSQLLEFEVKMHLVCKLKRFDRLILIGYVDVYFVCDKDWRKSTITYFFTLGDDFIN